LGFIAFSPTYQTAVDGIKVAEAVALSMVQANGV
jgi:hypothetical protein